MPINQTVFSFASFSIVLVKTLIQKPYSFTDPCEESKILSFASSIMKNIVTSSGRSSISVKLIVVLLSDQDQVLAVYLSLLQLVYNTL